MKLDAKVNNGFLVWFLFNAIVNNISALWLSPVFIVEGEIPVSNVGHTRLKTTNLPQVK